MNEIRSNPIASTSSDEEPAARAENRVDSILNEDFQVSTTLLSLLGPQLTRSSPTQLLSLFYLVLGKSRESPATFCMLVTMKRLLTHRKQQPHTQNLAPALTQLQPYPVTESGIYTEPDLLPFQARLAELKVIIEDGRPKPGIGPTQPQSNVADVREEVMATLLLRKWNDCGKYM